MEEEKCSECKNGLVFGEKSQCIYCELSQTTGNKSCPKCTKSVIRDKSSLYCELCKCFYHNSCNEFPLDDQYCTLLYEVPRNIKWFCDKCIWDTEKWISNYKVNDLDDSTGDFIENSTLVSDEDISDQETPSKYSQKNNKKLKRKRARPKASCDKSEIPSKALSSNQKDGIIENEDGVNENEDGNENNDNTNMMPFIKEEEVYYDSACEADDLNYNPWESDNSDSDWDAGPKKLSVKSKLKNTSPKKRGPKKKERTPKDPNKRRGNKFKCDQCPKTFMKEERFEAHKVWHTGDKKPYKCDQCSDCFVESRGLEQHKMKHTGEFPFICNYCGIGKARIDLLKSHIQIKHSDEKPFKCPDCDFCARTKQKIKKHWNHTHKIVEILKCTLCDYETKNKQCLKNHMRDHTGENFFMCDECGHNLKSLASLKHHQRTHTGERPYSCEVCGKTFRSRGSLRIHNFVHTKEKRAFCPICGYGFPTKDKLDVHLKTVHTDEKPFECETCGNKYKTKHNLKNHKLGKRGSCHPNMNTQKQKFESLQKFKSSSDTTESNMSDSNDSHLDPLRQTQVTQQQPPLLFYTGSNEKSMAPVYSNSHITATIHCPPSYLSVINYMDH